MLGRSFGGTSDTVRLELKTDYLSRTQLMTWIITGCTGSTEESINSVKEEEMTCIFIFLNQFIPSFTYTPWATPEGKELWYEIPAVSSLYYILKLHKMMSSDNYKK